MYQTYFWDFDGTLFDSYAVMAPALVYGFKRQQVEVSKDLAYQLMRQKSRGKAFKSLGKQWPQVDLKQAYADYKSYERAHLQSLQPFNGAKEVLAAIVAAGGQKELPKLDKFEINNTQFIDQEKMLNILRNLYWQASIAKNSYQFEINSDNPNYDYRLGGYRRIFDAYGWSDKYQDIDELIKDLHFVLKVDDLGANKYIQVDENGQPVKNPVHIKRIAL